ncbi:MAG: Asp-tRNA(Asn)/Glu-tRNA(Gln) amidotransferase subunit GatB [Bacillota bacterium]|nr:Asp-tRNA(Asn)/Glu-tRNA(Gln) amidotransferase subunit GatB [Bacillota bacterium]
MAYLVTIGIEIHVELKTKSKMFSPGRVDFDADPNLNVSEIDLAFPGTLPTINKEAVKMALKVCYGLDMEVDPLLKFDRKNYFYSDLPKGFQITQQFHPIGKKGRLVLSDQSTVGITRLHMEEDTAKQLHLGDQSLIDFNRAGVPLIEIVSEPEIHSGQQAADYVNTLRQLLVYLDVTDGKMEEGSMRCDVNISISKEAGVFGTKVEIKNLNSIANVQKAIDFEAKRQEEVLEAGGTIVQETRRFDEPSQTTVTMRKKEGAVDYRYFPEPNIVPIRLSQDFLDSVKETMVELPQERLERYLKNIAEDDARILVTNMEAGDFFDQVMNHSKNYQEVANFVITNVTPLGFENFKAEEIAKLVDKLKAGDLSSKQGKQVLKSLANSDQTVDQIIKDQGLVQVSDDGMILEVIEKILEKNPQVIVDYKNGKDNSIKFVMGQVMKETRGQANPAKAMELASQVLKSK